MKIGKSAIISAILKHGLSNFKLEILEYCDSYEVLKREDDFMNLLKPEYNIIKIAGSPLGSKRSEETRAKMSASKMGNSNGNKHAQKIEVTDLQTGIYISYNSMCEAAKALNLLISSISNYFSCNQKTSFKKRYLGVGAPKGPKVLPLD